MVSHKYKIHDNSINHYEEKLNIAESLGYDFVSEAYEKLTKSGKTPRQIGCIFDVTKDNILYRLRNMGIKTRDYGGRNNTKLDVKKVRVILRGKKHNQYYVDKYGVSLTTIYDIRNRKTWKDVEV